MRKMPRNPFQDQINAWNLKDIDEGLKADAYLKKSSKPIPDDINNQVFPRGDAPPVNVLKPEELSMKDLLDQIQIQTILNNNTVPFVEKKIKSEVTQEMIKDFQNESAKPIEINGTLYKFRPPDVNIDLIDIPTFPTEEEYKKRIRAVAEQEIRMTADIEDRRLQVEMAGRKLIDDFDAGRISEDEFRNAYAHYDNIHKQLGEAFAQNQATLASLQKDYDNYEEMRLQHVADVERITTENKKNIANYADEIKSRNSGMEIPQQEGESDADYAQRMIDTAHTIVDPDQVLIQSQLFLYNTMKDRLSEMMQPYKAEGVLNQIIKVDGYDGLMVIKDRWASLKKGLTDTFGDLRRVENTESIALYLLDNTPFDEVTPKSPPKYIYKVPPTPNTIPSTSGPLRPYNATTAPHVSRYPVKYKPTPIPSDLFDYLSVQSSRSRFANVPEVPDLFTSRGKVMNPKLTPQGMFSKQQPYITEKELQLEKERQAQERGNIIAEMDYPSRFYPKEKKKTPIKTVTHITDKPEMPPPPRVTRSTSSKASEKLPIDLLTNDDLVAILQHKGLPYLVGHTRESKEKNYAQAMGANLIPNRPQLEPRSVVSKMTTKELKQYLDSKGVRGSNGGLPSKQADREMLLRMYDRYATPELQGKGIDIKSRFAIVDGEIQSGNNNPQLMRDAKKLLKEMTQQKMITLYEAKSHMKHLRKINKI